jgi:hypothetical protein
MLRAGQRLCTHTHTHTHNTHTHLAHALDSIVHACFVAPHRPLMRYAKVSNET